MIQTWKTLQHETAPTQSVRSASLTLQSYDKWIQVEHLPTKAYHEPSRHGTQPLSSDAMQMAGVSSSSGQCHMALFKANYQRNAGNDFANESPS